MIAKASYSLLSAVLLALLSVYNSTGAKLYTQTKNNNAYKICKIDSLSTVYLIFVSRRDSLFEIISLKPKKAMLNCSRIKTGQFHLLCLKSVIYSDKIQSSNRLLVTQYNFYGTYISNENSPRRDLYQSSNIQGLCIK